MSSFTHLLGRRKSASAAKADDTDDDAKKAKKANKRAEGGDMDDVDENEDDKKDKLDDVVDDHTGEDDLADDDDENHGKKAKGKKAVAKSEKDDDDDDDDDKKKDDAKKAKATRLTERARCERIFASPHAAGRPNVAAHFAFKTNLSATDAIGAMAAMGEAEAANEPPAASRAASGPSDLRTRMSAQPDVNVGPAPEKPSPNANSDFMARFKRVADIVDGKA